MARVGGMRTSCVGVLLVLLVSSPVWAQHDHHPWLHIDPAMLVLPIELSDGLGRIPGPGVRVPRGVDGYNMQGQALLAAYAWIDAARSFNAAIRLDPAHAGAWLGLAKALQEMHQHEAARRALECAERHAANLPAVDSTRTLVALFRQQLEATDAPAQERAEHHEAYKRSLDAFIAADPTDADRWVLRGMAEEPSVWGKGQAGGVGAIAFFEAALRRQPEHLAAHHYLAHAYENIGQFKAAVDHARAFAASAPMVPHAQHMFAHALPRLGRWEEARAQLLEAEELERQRASRENIPASEDWHHGHNLHLRGIVEFRLGHLAAAEALLREAYGLSTGGPAAGQYGSPWIEYLLVRGRHAEALTAARALAERVQPLARVLGRALASQALAAAGRLDEARTALAEAHVANDAFHQFTDRHPRFRWARVMSRPHLEAAGALLALHAGQADAGPRLLAVSDALAATRQIDAWADGLLRLERLARDATAAAAPALAAALLDRLRRIDDTYQPVIDGANPYGR